MTSAALAAMPLARKAVTFSCCQASRPARTAMAILVSKRVVTSLSLPSRPAGVLNAGAPPDGPACDNEMVATDSARDWARYWRADGVPVEAMHAHFTSHVYHRHSHESYSFGVTETGAQTFTCRNGRHVSGAGMIMAFNPDDPHDGHAATEGGFTYRMVHIWPEFFAGLAGAGRPLPLFRVPVLADPVVARSLRCLHSALTRPASDLERYERLTATARLLVRHASRHAFVRQGPT